MKLQLREFDRTKKEKDDLLMKNVELLVENDKYKHEYEDLTKECDELRKRISNLNENKTSDDITSKLNETIFRLEESLADKNKTIKLQQQRLNDMKKTFQKDLIQNQLAKEDNSDNESKITNSTFNEQLNNNDNLNNSEINFTYLKNVIFKFMTSSEYESIHLVKAISVLLHFTKDEEKLVKDTLEWKMSWFAPLIASKPSLLKK